MPEIINALFGRSRNDTAHSGEDVADPTAAQTDSPQPDTADVAGAGETVDTNAIEVEPTEITTVVVPTGDAIVTEDNPEAEADSAPADDEAAIETAAEESAEADDDLTDEAALEADEDEDAEDIAADESDDESDDAAADDDLAEDAEEDGNGAEDVEPTTADDLEEEIAADADEDSDDAEDIAAEEPDEATADDDLAEATADAGQANPEDIEPTAEDSDDVAADDDLTEEAATAEDTAVEVAPVAVEAGADDDESEPLVAVVPVETRVAAGVRGSISVGDGVVVKVVTIVAGKVDGVHNLDGVSIEAVDDTATITISLVVEYGHAVKSLAEQIRTGVIEAVEQFLGLDVAAVDVHVSDIHTPA
jgi:uncharacterized alkaline shock family protein YloU